MEQVVIGALITVIVGAVAAVITARLEHRRWLRQERLEAWTSFTGLCVSLMMGGAQVRLTVQQHRAAGDARDAERRNDHFEKFMEQAAALHAEVDKMPLVQARVMMLGPNRAADKTQDVSVAVSDATRMAEMSEAEEENVMNNARRELREWATLARGIIDAD